MNQTLSKINREIRAGWLILALGLVLLVGGGLLRFFGYALAVNPRLVMAFGVLVSGAAVGILVKNLTLRKNPEQARRMQIEEQDERSLAIRHRAGYQAFQVGVFLAALALIIYSLSGGEVISRSQPDLLWYYLAISVVVQIIVYVIGLARAAE